MDASETVASYAPWEFHDLYGYLLSSIQCLFYKDFLILVVGQREDKIVSTRAASQQIAKSEPKYLLANASAYDKYSG